MYDFNQLVCFIYVQYNDQQSSEVSETKNQEVTFCSRRLIKLLRMHPFECVK